MYCYNCGVQLPDTANFCSNCGKQQHTNTETSAGIQWETCETSIANLGKVVSNPISGIAFSFGLSSPEFYFEAHAVGPKGSYLAAKSKPFTGRKFLTGVDPKVDAIFNEFVAQLLQDGWEPLQVSDENPHRRQFRRKIEK